MAYLRKYERRLLCSEALGKMIKSTNACRIDVDEIVEFTQSSVRLPKALQWLRKIPGPARRAFGEGGGSHFGFQVT